MKKRIVRLSMLLTVFAILIAACSSQTPLPQISATEGGAASSPGPQSSGGGGELCNNEFQPVVEGATYSRTSTSSLGEGSYTATITNLTTNGFHIERSGTLSSGRSYTSDEIWVCTEEGLAQYLTEDLAAIYTGSSGATVTVTMNSNEGVTLPKSVQPGDDWSQTMNVDVTGPDSTTNWTVTYSFTAAGNEAVTVPAGTFETTKIYFHVDSASAGQTVLEADITFWMALGVGLVKSDFGMEGEVLSTTVLDSYSIP